MSTMSKTFFPILKSNTSWKNSFRSETVQSYMCQLCEFKTKTVGDLKIHMRMHSGDKPYLCRVCQKTFSNISGLKNHERTHSEENHFCVFIVNKYFIHLQ